MKFWMLRAVLWVAWVALLPFALIGVVAEEAMWFVHDAWPRR